MKNNSAPASKTRAKTTPSRHYSKQSGSSTREVILQKANEIINRTGVVDFRIEALATALNLSPGNITYHFPKKEDIISSIWNKYISEMKNMEEQALTPLLDIKQLFLLCRGLAVKTVAYMGVAAHYYGDIGVLIRDNQEYNDHLAVVRKAMFESYDILHNNGYLSAISDPIMKNLTFEAQYMPLRWWINSAMIGADVDAIAGKLDSYIGMSLYPLIPHLTKEGRGQLYNILNVLKPAPNAK